jgi:hypothetical protein
MLATFKNPGKIEGQFSLHFLISRLDLPENSRGEDFGSRPPKSDFALNRRLLDSSCFWWFFQRRLPRKQGKNAISPHPSTASIKSFSKNRL